MFDTGLNVPECRTTLFLQQARLIAGKRPAQMFPLGTRELPLPAGMSRTRNERGVFHYDPAAITEREILTLSADGRENEFLELGPYSKADVLHRMKAGERLTAISEYSPFGIEIRTAAATDSTLADQRRYFETTKDAGNSIVIGLPFRATERLPVF